ncbi:hypothetical protein Goshw_007715 [Gossypium schwendimanii]|uniref:Uncharacterized protein n=1 Tax=Gossypium schwendimanii TaxID=34291 RepID=A0A7J9MSC2_GOSSC|nr:hypothetical protein [Gossypium schwendimanii]
MKLGRGFEITTSREDGFSFCEVVINVAEHGSCLIHILSIAEIVVSGGMSMPQILSTVDTRLPLESRSDRS